MPKTFRGILESGVSEIPWNGVRLPFDPLTEWPERNRLRVTGTINGTPFRNSLFGSAENGYFLFVNRRLLKAANLVVGSLVDIVIEPDLEERSAAAPPELVKFLKQDRSLKKWFEALNYSTRNWMAYTINQPKSPEARKRRAEQIAEQMLLAMEGEEIPPPVLQAAFRRHSQALEGWHAMTPIQRRMHLLAIFHCQGPEARTKRAAAAAQEAQRIATRNRHE